MLSHRFEVLLLLTKLDRKTKILIPTVAENPAKRYFFCFT
jgi:hypothetical protein